MKSGVSAVEYTVEGLRLSDGSSVPADVIVWATGFKTNMRDNVRQLFGADVADRIDDYFALDSEGESRGAWKLQRKPKSRNLYPALTLTRSWFDHARCRIESSTLLCQICCFTNQSKPPVPTFCDIHADTSRSVQLNRRSEKGLLLELDTLESTSLTKILEFAPKQGISGFVSDQHFCSRS